MRCNLSVIVVVRGNLRSRNGDIVLEVNEEEVWDRVEVPPDSKVSGLAISTPHGCIIVVGIDILVGGDKALLTSFHDPLDPETLKLVEKISEDKEIKVAVGGDVIATFKLGEDDIKKVEYVAGKTKECSQMQDKPVVMDKAIEWFIENFS